MITVYKTSIISGVENSMELDITIEQLDHFENRHTRGGYVQTIFPNLSKQEREFLLTGMSLNEQSKFYGDGTNSR